MKFEHIMYDWRQGGAEEDWVNALAEMGLHVTEDPSLEYGDMYGFFITHRKPTNGELFKMMCEVHSKAIALAYCP